MASKIIGVGMYAPPKELTNLDFEKLVDTNDAWITERTGIKTRHIAEVGVPNSDMTVEAARIALADAGVDPAELDIVIVGTLTPDMPFPATACFLQSKIGAVNAYAMDVSAACSGFIYSLSVADALIRAGRGKKALVLGSEMLSSIVDYTDRSTCILFGDGAGAAVLTECPEGDGVLSCHLHSDGNLWKLIHCPGGGTLIPYSHEMMEQKLRSIRMAGNETFKHAVLKMVEVCGEALDRNGVGIDDVKLFIPHQANLRIIQVVGKRLGIPDERVFVNLQKYGNTSAASIPIALAEAKAQGRFGAGDLVLMVAFGGGLTWASALMRM